MQQKSHDKRECSQIPKNKALSLVRMLPKRFPKDQRVSVSVGLVLPFFVWGGNRVETPITATEAISGSVIFGWFYVNASTETSVLVWFWFICDLWFVMMLWWCTGMCELVFISNFRFCLYSNPIGAFGLQIHVARTDKKGIVQSAVTNTKHNRHRLCFYKIYFTRIVLYRTQKFRSLGKFAVITIIAWKLAPHMKNSKSPV